MSTTASASLNRNHSIPAFLLQEIPRFVLDPHSTCRGGRASSVELRDARVEGQSKNKPPSLENQVELLSTDTSQENTNLAGYTSEAVSRVKVEVTKNFRENSEAPYDNNANEQAALRSWSIEPEDEDVFDDQHSIRLNQSSQLKSSKSLQCETVQCKTTSVVEGSNGFVIPTYSQDSDPFNSPYSRTVWSSDSSKAVSRPSGLAQIALRNNGPSLSSGFGSVCSPGSSLSGGQSTPDAKDIARREETLQLIDKLRPYMTNQRMFNVSLPNASVLRSASYPTPSHGCFQHLPTDTCMRAPQRSNSLSSAESSREISGSLSTIPAVSENRESDDEYNNNHKEENSTCCTSRDVKPIQFAHATELAYEEPLYLRIANLRARSKHYSTNSNDDAENWLANTLIPTRADSLTDSSVYADYTASAPQTIGKPTSTISNDSGTCQLKRAVHNSTANPDVHQSSPNEGRSSSNLSTSRDTPIATSSAIAFSTRLTSVLASLQELRQSDRHIFQQLLRAHDSLLALYEPAGGFSFSYDAGTFRRQQPSVTLSASFHSHVQEG